MKLLLLSFPLSLFAASQTFVSQGPAPCLEPVDLVGPNNTNVGSVQSILESPLNSNVLYVGGVNGGVWQSIDFGQTWSTNTDQKPSLSIASLAFDFNDVSFNTIYAGTGSTTNGSVGPFVGGPSGLVYKTTNGGSSWSTLAAAGDMAGNSIAGGIAARGSNILSGGYEPDELTFALTNQGGLWRSTDGGATFVRVPGIGAVGNATSSLVGAFDQISDPNTVYASTFTVSGPNLNAVLNKSSNFGSLWTPFMPDPMIPTNQVAKIATGPNGSLAAGLIDVSQLNVLPGGQFNTLLYFDGTSWTSFDISGLNLNPSGQGVINSSIAIDPNDARTIYVSGSINDNFPFPGIVMKLQIPVSGMPIVTDLTFGGDTSTIHADTRMIVVVNGGLIVSEDAGLNFLSNTSGEGNWRSINGSNGGLSLIQGYAIAYDGNNNLILTAGQDTAISQQSAPVSFIYTAPPITGDGTGAACNDSGSVSYFYSSVQTLGDFNRVTVFDGVAYPAEAIDLNPDHSTWALNFVTPFVLNRVDPFQMAFGGGDGNVYYGTDAPPATLINLNASLVNTNQPNIALAYGTNSGPNALVVGNAVKEIWYTSDVTSMAFAQLNNYTPTMASSTPLSLVFDGRTPNQFFLADANDLWSATSANTFTSETANFTALGLSEPSAVEFISTNGVNALVVGGFFTSSTESLAVADSPAVGTLMNWRRFGLGLPNTLVDQIVYNVKSDVIAASLFGRGSWIMYDVTSNFASATVLQFGLANNNSTPDTSILTDGNYASRPLHKWGTGTLTITGAASYTGGSFVHNGNMYVNGSILDDVSVDGGALLGGSGSIGGSVDLSTNATLSPGTSATTSLSIGNNLTMSSGSFLQVEINPTSSSQVNVSNVAFPSGNVVVNQDAGNYPATGSYQILSALNGINSNFASNVLGGLPGFDFSLQQLSDVVNLLYRRFIITSGLSGNAFSLANYLNRFAPTSEAEMLLSVLSGRDLSNALFAASPVRNAIPTFVSDNNMFNIANTISSHFAAMHWAYIFGQMGNETLDHSAEIFEQKGTKKRTSFIELPKDELLAANDNDFFVGAAAVNGSGHSKNKKSSGKRSAPYGSVTTAARKVENNDVWADILFDFAHQDEQDETPAFRFNAQQVFVGYDRYFSSNGIFGIATGYARNEIHQEHHLGTSDIDTFAFAPYGTVYYWHCYTEFALVSSINLIENKRHVFFEGFDETAKSHHKIYQLMPHLSFGYDYNLKRWGVLEPFAQLDWVVNWENGYKEHGSDAFDMRVKSHTSSMLRSELGLNFYQNWQWSKNMIILKEVAGYVNKASFGVGTVTSTLIGFPSSFITETFRGNQSLFNCSFDFLWKNSSGFYGMVGYDGEFGSGYISNEIQLKIGCFF